MKFSRSQLAFTEKQMSCFKLYCFQRILSQNLPAVFLSSELCNILAKKAIGRISTMTIDFKGSHYPKNVILYAVFFYVRYAVSYRDLEEIMQERGVDVDHATLNIWVVKYSPVITNEA